jgi:hypothetical protein
MRTPFFFEGKKMRTPVLKKKGKENRNRMGCHVSRPARHALGFTDAQAHAGNGWFAAEQASVSFRQRLD